MNTKLSFVLVMLLGAGLAFAQEPVDTTLIPTDSLGVHPWDGHENDTHIVIPNQSHWSVYVAGGFNVFDGDYTSEKGSALWAPSVSLGGAYHWNNTWSLGAEYKFHNYKVKGSDNMVTDASGNEVRRDAETMLKGMAHQINAYVAFDIFNAFRPQNTEKVFALDLILGGGAFIKKNSIYYGNVREMSKILTDTPWAYNTGDIERAGGTQKDDKYKCWGVFFGGISAEFNLNRSFQLGLRAIYNYTTTDQIDGRPYRGNNNDGIFDVEALLRYKIQPRNKSNVRNFMVPQQIDDWNTGILYEDPAVGAAKRAKYLINPQKDTIVFITRDTVWMAPPALATNKGIRDYVVFFENDVPELDNVAMSITGEAAMLLKQETEYKAVVVGSCDNTGAVEYNKWLATQRAINVTETLTGMGVEQDRIYLVGRGIMQDDRDEGSFGLNRRVEIHIVTDEGMAKQKDELSFFEQYKNVKRGSAVRKPGEGKDASSSEALKEAIRKMKEALAPAKEEPKAKEIAPAVEKAIVAIPESEILDRVVVTPNTTLSKLAKQYYGNGNLWVKIFEANRDRLASPDHLEEGVELIIPKVD